MASDAKTDTVTVPAGSVGMWGRSSARTKEPVLERVTLPVPELVLLVVLELL